MTSKNSTFVLHIDPVKVDREFKTMERGHTYHAFNPMVTKLEDLGISDEKLSDTIFSQHNGMNFVTYYPDYVNAKAYPTTTSIPCFYCTEPFSTKPIGIPIRFIPSYYKSNIQGKRDNTSDIKVDVCLYNQYEMEEAEKRGEKIIHRNYFQTEGNFCSFPCMLAFIGLHKHEMNNDTIPLVKKLFYMLHGPNTEFTKEAAPDIRLLKKFGGHLSLAEFRSYDGRLYNKTINYVYPSFSDNDRPPLCVPSAHVFQYYGTKL